VYTHQVVQRVPASNGIRQEIPAKFRSCVRRAGEQFIAIIFSSISISVRYTLYRTEGATAAITEDSCIELMHEHFIKS
jgi:hypothetical protein